MILHPIDPTRTSLQHAIYHHIRKSQCESMPVNRHKANLIKARTFLKTRLGRHYQTNEAEVLSIIAEAPFHPTIPLSCFTHNGPAMEIARLAGITDGWSPDGHQVQLRYPDGRCYINLAETADTLGIMFLISNPPRHGYGSKTIQACKAYAEQHRKKLTALVVEQSVAPFWIKQGFTPVTTGNLTYTPPTLS